MSEKLKEFDIKSRQNLTCPLCLGKNCTKLDHALSRDFFRCAECFLTFVPAYNHLTAEVEKEIYDYHENDPNNEGYRQFLSRLYTPMVGNLRSGARGLDFGCGPGPALAMMFREAGFSMDVYDPFYANEPGVLNQLYDFVTSTEVVEHLREPRGSFDLLFQLIGTRGTLGLMTKLTPDLERFSDWHYTRDLTHITFYARETMAYIAQLYQRKLTIIGNDVMIFEPKEA